MKKVLGFAVVMLVSASVCMAQGLFVGAHGGYTMGGDVENEDFAFGAQAGYELNENLSVELAWSSFSDEDSAEGITTTADVNVIALTARYAFPMSDLLSPYVGGGVNYFMPDLESSLSSDAREEAESLAGLLGVTVDELLVTPELDNTIGYHICGGVNANVTESVQVFGEYRYAFNSVEGDGMEDDDYNNGLIRVGANFLF